MNVLRLVLLHVMRAHWGTRTLESCNMYLCEELLVTLLPGNVDYKKGK